MRECELIERVVYNRVYSRFGQVSKDGNYGRMIFFLRIL